MSVEDSESRRFELNIRLSFSQGDLVPTSAPELPFSGFSKSWEHSVLRFGLIASLFWKILAGIFGIQTF